MFLEQQEKDEWDEVLDLQTMENCFPIIDNNDSGISFVAQLLETRLLNGNIYCNFCREVLEKNTKVIDDLCVNSKLGKPCLSTYKICKLTDNAIKGFINTGPNFKKKIYLSVMNNIDLDQIFPEFFDPLHDIDHKHFLIKFFIDEYTNKKCSYMAKQKTIALQKRYIRNSLRKLGHFMHQ